MDRLRARTATDQTLAQFSPQHFPRWRPRNRIDKVHFARLFVVGETIGDEARRVLLSALSQAAKSFSKDYERDGNLSRVRIGLGDDAAVADCRVLEQN